MITLPKNTKTPCGAYGTYFRVSRGRGIKILKGSWRSMQGAYNSHQFDMARQEAELLKIAEDSGVTPRCYGVRVVKRGTVYRVGILMQHLGNKTLADLGLPEHQRSDVYDRVNDALIHAGINHCDLHTRNIMFCDGKYYAIDFSPDCIDVMESNA